ncbi:MAG: hypothetical protein JJE04_02415 [Acidobacteriia bacterium]|nr:hypothetical protein [Terriglobia bacterium]
MNCQDFEERLSARLDCPQEPDPVLDQHLAACPHCRHCFERLAAADAIVMPALSALQPSPDFDGRLRRKLRRQERTRWTGMVADLLNATGVLLMAALALQCASWSLWAAGTLALGAISGAVPLFLRRDQA